MRGELECGSDHSPQLAKIRTQQRSKEKITVRRLKDLDQKTFADACKVAASEIQNALPEEGMNSTQALETAAEEITRAIQHAFKTATPQRQVSGSGYRWWNEDCSDGKKEVIRAKRQFDSLSQLSRLGATNLGEDLQIAKQNYKKARDEMKSTVMKASRKFYKDLVTGLKTLPEVHKAAKWVVNPQKTLSPALKKADGSLHSTPAEKIQILRERHLAGSGLPDVPRPQVRLDRRRAWDPVTEKEAEEAIRKPQNTAPGKDGIWNKLLAMCWPELGKLITRLFDGCVQQGYHPTCFKSAKMVALPKPGKRDRSDPKAYRLISLLPTLAKALERIVAKRLTTAAMAKRLFEDNYTCALPKRSAPDLTLALVNEIRENMDEGKITSILTFDVQGAFDGILPNRMVARLQEQRWPSHVCKWVQSFLESRSAQISLDGNTEPPGPTSGSLPQGSPISPILYMLFMAPLYKSWSLQLRGYMDDGLWIIKGDNLENCIRDLKPAMGYTIKWCADNGLQLDHGKTQLLHLTRKNLGSKNPDLVMEDLPVIKATPIGGSLKWLGVCFDRGLTFHKQVDQVAGKLERVTHSLRILRGCKHGAPAKELTQVVRTSILASATYTAATWWKPGCVGNKKKATKLEKPLRRALLVALPAFSSTPTSLLHMTANCPPIHIALDSAVKREAIRWYTIDKEHPLWKTRHFTHQKQVLGLLPKPLPRYGPIKDVLPTADPAPQAAVHNGLEKEIAAKKHIEWKGTCNSSDIWLYTDGSKLSSGWTGAGWISQRDNRQLTEGCFACGKWAEVADAEIRAIRHGIQSLNRGLVQGSNAIWICSDNQAAVDRMNSVAKKTSTSQHELDHAKTLAQKLRDVFPNLKIHCIWVPGHKDIEGNEKADALAKSAAVEAPDYSMSLSRAKRWIQEDLSQSIQDWVRDQATIKDHSFRKDLEFPKRGQLGVPEGPRRLQGIIMAALSSHGDFAAYHQRRKHQNATLRCQRCGADKDETHEWSCRRQPNY
ncbi:reverse transcriptase [Ceratocystis lukuohia]|uniref:Reverse transcriptase n=1 Tax=Ceratocystis lukuohia TaxID=2019550 RepID=A0ABR4MQY0_9PEZI